MQITVWSVAADDDNGTYASVHETELAAYRRLIVRVRATTFFPSGLRCAEVEG